MEYMNARSSQRFLTFLIDFLLIQFVVAFIVSFIPAYGESMDFVMEFYKSFLQGDMVEDIEVLAEVLKKLFMVLGIIVSVQVPIYFLYLVILPHFWKKQTIGRLATHVRVVSKDGKEAKLYQLILRELIGGMLLLNLLSGFFVIPLLFWYFSSTLGRSLADLIGGTRLVDTQSMLFDDGQGKGEEREYLDAEFYEQSSDDSEPSSEEETEYKVF